MDRLKLTKTDGLKGLCEETACVSGCSSKRDVSYESYFYCEERVNSSVWIILFYRMYSVTMICCFILECVQSYELKRSRWTGCFSKGVSKKLFLNIYIRVCNLLRTMNMQQRPDLFHPSHNVETKQFIILEKKYLPECEKEK